MNICHGGVSALYAETSPCRSAMSGVENFFTIFVTLYVSLRYYSKRQ